MSDQGGFWLCLVSGLILTIGCLAWYLSMHLSMATAREWPSVRGEVLESRIDTHGSKRTSYRPRIRYRYQAGGRVYEGDAVHLNEPFGFYNRQSADAFLADYPAGGEVRVHHDPARPAVSSLLFDGDYWPVLIGLPFGLIILSLAWFLRDTAFGDRSVARKPRSR